MRSQPTARDAVVGTLVAANEHPWVQPPPNMVADAVLAALGIPADTPTDDVRAGVLYLHLCRDSFHNEITKTVNPDDPQQQDDRPWWEVVLVLDDRPWWEDESHIRIAHGLTPASAVLALAAKLETPGA